MTVSANVFAQALEHAFLGGINWASDTINIALLGAGYTPSQSDAVWSDISAHEVSGTGYPAGGQTLTTPTHSSTVADSWGTAWASGTFGTGAVVRPSTGNGYLYYAEAGGVSGGSEPTWPTTVGAVVVDSGVTWSCLGKALVKWSSDAPSWPSSTITANYAVIYDAQTGVVGTEPLICVIAFGGSVSSSSSTLTITPPTLGWFWISPA